MNASRSSNPFEHDDDDPGIVSVRRANHLTSSSALSHTHSTSSGFTRPYNLNPFNNHNDDAILPNNERTIKSRYDRIDLDEITTTEVSRQELPRQQSQSLNIDNDRLSRYEERRSKRGFKITGSGGIVENKSTWSQGQADQVTSYPPDDENQIIRFLLSERVYGFPYSDGTVFSNYKHYVFNNHPFISIFLVNSAHPYNRKRRIIVFLCTLAFVMVASYYITRTTYFDLLARCRDGCNIVNVTNQAGSESKVCKGGYNDGLDYETYTKDCQYYRSWYLSAIVGAVSVPYGIFLRFLVTCGCFQGQTLFQVVCCCAWLRRVFEIFGGIGIGLISLASIGMLAWALIECWLSKVGFDIFLALLIGKLWGFFDWFFITSPYFCFRYAYDKRHFQQSSYFRNSVAAVSA